MITPTRNTLFLLFSVAALAMTTAACTKPDVPVPDGWKRVEVRQGLFSTDLALADVNFAANMPEDWGAFDIWTPDSSPSGGIRGMSRNGSLSYRVASQDDGFTRPSSNDEHYLTWTETVGGFELILWRTHSTGPTPDSEFGHAGGYFRQIPGAPDGLPASLAFTGKGLADSNVAEVHDLIRSVRLAPQPEPPMQPGVAITPSPDWQRLEVTVPRDPDRVILELMAPVGWTAETFAGLDSLPGEISNGSIRIGFDLGGGYSCLDGPGEHLWVSGGFAELKFWEEEISGRNFYLYRPVDGSRDDRGRIGRTGACIPHLPIVDDPNYQARMGIGIAARAESEDEQELVLAVIRTIRALEDLR